MWVQETEQIYKQKNKLIACHGKYHKQTNNNKIESWDSTEVKSLINKKDLVMKEI